MGAGNGGSILVHQNNADREGTTAIVTKFRNLLKRTKQARIGQIILILSGILPVIGSRNRGYMNSRRMAINRLVQQLCKEEDMGFVEQLCGEGGDVYEWTRG